MKKVLLLLVVGLAACGELSPEPPESKLNSSPGNSTTSNNSNSTPNNSPPNNATNAQPLDLMSRFGTEGPSDTNTTSPGGNALCDLSDVRTTDLEGGNESSIPGDPWDTVESDAPGRCGDDRETLAWRLMNCERIANQLEPFECDLRMVWMGREHTLDMIARDYFSHSNPEGEDPFARMNRHGIGFRNAAENIAANSDVLSSHLSWMDSTGHRGNILGNFTHVGVGSEDAPGGLLSTTVFITP